MKIGTIIENGKKISVILSQKNKIKKIPDFENSKINICILDLINKLSEDHDYLNKIHIESSNFEGINEKNIDWAPPIFNPSKIIGVAFNNKELVKKAHVDPGVPNFFLKPPSCLQGHNKPIIVDPEWGAVIPEPEICAVIGKKAKHISRENALDYIFGYTIHNDVTSHGLKFGKDSIAITYDQDLARPEFYKWRNLHGSDDTDAYYVYHTRSKGTDTFGPMGPWITTKEEVKDPNNLQVSASLNTEIFTVDHTSNYRFSIEDCISEASKYFTLEVGDLISFGTTGKGTGRFKRGHKSVLIGEESGSISITIDTLGTLSNNILHQKGGA